MATIFGTGGNDTLVGDDVDFFGNGGNDTIYGLGGDDTIDGRGGSNTLYGQDGNDIFLLGTYRPQTQVFHSTIDGGNGFDTLDFTGVTLASYEFVGVASRDGAHAKITIGSLTYIDSAVSFEQIIGGSAGLYIQLDNSTTGTNNWMAGIKIVSHSAADTDSDIRTGHGADTVIGGAGIDNVYLDGGNDDVTLSGRGGAVIIESVSGAADHVTATATGANYQLTILGDALTSDAANFDLASGTGTIGTAQFSVHGFETVYIGASTHISTVLGDDVANHLEISDGNYGSVIFDGRGGEDTLLGGLSGDQLAGGTGNDLLSGGGGNDLIQGGSGDDQLYGGSGDNIIDGGDGHDYIWSTQFVGGADNNLIQSDNETLTGGNGNDHIWGGNNDSIDAGDGIDYVNGMQGADTIHGGAGADRLFGGASGDNITGDDGNDHINGNKGNDTIDAGGGDDSLRGGQDDDVVSGGDGNDTVSGDIGNDTVRGGAGLDQITGGDGNDAFLFESGDAAFSAGNGGGQTDEVIDLNVAADKLALGFTPAVLLTGAAQGSFSSAASAAQSLFDGHAGDHEVAALAVGTDTYLFFSANGGGSIDAAIKLDQIDPATLNLTLFV